MTPTEPETPEGTVPDERNEPDGETHEGGGDEQHEERGDDES